MQKRHWTHRTLLCEIYKQKKIMFKLMNILEKAKLLSKAGQYDSCGPRSCEVNIRNSLGGIYHAKAEHESCRIFKTLMDNSCSFDCRYCANSNKCNKKKARYEPEELGRLFNYLKKNLSVNGLFLSSAVSGNPDKVTEKMIEVVKIIREKYRFKGYVHFKVLPGVSKELIKQAAELSNRMSINIEAPTKEIMSEMSSCKDYENDIIKRQRWISELKKSQTTQVIVNEFSTDRQILKMMKYEYESIKLKRIYFSAFKPIKGTEFENKEPCSANREVRLYNVDFLIRKYNYKFKEFNAIMEEGMLPRQDPKAAIAKKYFDKPLDINEAGYDDLIKVPGIGPKTAKKIIKKKKIKSYLELQKLGGHVKRAKPFIKLNGKSQKRLSDF